MKQPIKKVSIEELKPKPGPRAPIVPEGIEKARFYPEGLPEGPPPSFPKNWEKLSDTEKWIYTDFLPHPTVTKVTGALEKFNNSWVGKVLPVLDVLAEGVERGFGLAAQYTDARERGPEAIQDFTSHLGAAWRAGSFFYNVTNIPLGADKNEIYHADLPGYSELYNIRKGLLDGKSMMDIEAELQEDMGALYLRGALQDAAGHILLDPLNYIMPRLKIPTRLMLARGNILYKIGNVSDEAIDFAKTAEKVAGTNYEAALKAAGAVFDEATGTWKGAKLDDIPKINTAMQEALKATETLAEMEGRALNWWQKTVVNLTGGMPLSADTAVDWINKAPKGAKRLLPWNWFKLTPQSRAMETLQLIALNTQNIIAGETDYIRMADRITDALEGLTSPKLGHAVTTPAGRAAMSWLKGADVVVKDMALKMAASAPERAQLDALARLLNMPLDEVMGHLISGQPEIVMDKINDVLRMPPQEGLEALHQLFGEMVQTGELGADNLKALGLLFKDMPYSSETFKLHLLANLWDHAAKVAITKFGLEAAGWWTKAANTLKAAESLVFLRMNPKYFVLNVLNNEVTGIARGAWNLMRPEDIMAYWERVGVVHPRLAQGIGMGGLGVRETGEQAFDSLMKAYKVAAGEIAGASQMTEGWLGQLGQKIKNIKLPADAASWAQAAERSASMRFMTQGHIEAMNWYWRAGRGFDKIDDFIPGLGDRLGDEVVRQLHNSIASAKNEAEIANIVYESSLNLNVRSVLEKAATDLDIPIEKIDDVFGPEFIGRLDEMLGPALQSGKPENVRNAMFVIRDDIARHIDDWFVNTDPTELLLDGPNGVFRVYGELQGNEFDMWDAHLKTLEEEVAAIRQLPPEARGAKWGILLKREDAAWGRHFDWYQKRMGAMLDAIKQRGFNAQFADGRKLGEVIKTNLTERIKAIQKFHTDKRKLLDHFFATKFDDVAKRELAWERVTGELDTMYRNLIASEERTVAVIDEAIGAMVPEAYRGNFLTWRGDVRAARRAYMTWNRDTYEAARGLTGEARARFFDEFYAPHRQDFIKHIQQIEKEGLVAMAGGEFVEGAFEVQLGRRLAAAIQSSSPHFEVTEVEGLIDGKYLARIRMGKRTMSGRIPIEVSTELYRQVPERQLSIFVEEVGHTVEAIMEPEDFVKLFGGDEHVMTAAIESFLLEPEKLEPGLRIYLRDFFADNDDLYGVLDAVRRTYGETFQTVGEAKGISFFPDQTRIVPQTVPMGQAANAVWYSDGAKIIDGIEEAALRAIKEKKLKFTNLDATTQADLTKYVDHVTNQFGGTRMAAMNFAEVRRDSALLNYTRRTNLDTMLGTICPYAYWPTHTMFGWALWSLERPLVLSTYMRLRKMYEVAGGSREIPQRLRGYSQVPIKLPFWEDWMGPGIFINPLRIGLPIEMLMYPYERYVETKHGAEQSAEYILEQMLEDGDISQEEYESAINSHSGSAWDRALKRARTDDDSWLDFAAMLTSPHAPLMWAWNKAARPDEPWAPGPLMPITRQLKGVTALLGIGPPGGINIEGGIRKTLGLPEFDEWDDYRVDRMLSNMVAEGEISTSEAIIAMIDRSGDIYEEAERRAGKEFGVRTAFGILGIPANIYPPGEEKQRQLYREFSKAMETENPDVISKFFDEHPEIKARLALFDSPEERMRTFLVDQLWAKWNDLSGLDKDAVKEALGPEFQTFFLNKDSRNYDAINVDVMGLWLRSLGGEAPTILGGTAIPIKRAPPEIARLVDIYYDQREQYFDYDRIWRLQRDYFNLTSAGRRSFLQQHPELKAYWEWRRTWLYRHPSAAPYIEDDPAKLPKYRSEAELRQMQQLEWAEILGEEGYNIAMDILAGVDDGQGKALLEKIAKEYNLGSIDELLMRVGG